jgi:hypothetical protein
MPETHWSNKETDSYIARVVKVLNREAFSLPGTTVKERAWHRLYHKRLLKGDVKQAFEYWTEEQWKGVPREHARLAEVLAWRNGAALPSTFRRCKYEKCARFFRVPKSRPGCLYCKPKLCSRNFRSLKSMNKKKREIRRSDLERVKIAMQSIPADAPDWKRRVARKARVKMNFISYFFRFGQLKKS